MFAIQENSIGTPTLVAEMGMRITKKYGNQLVDGIFALMKELGIRTGETITPRSPSSTPTPPCSG